MELLGWMLVGVVIGVLARFLLPRRAVYGPVLLILLGIAGAMLGGFLLQAADATVGTPLSFPVAALGAAGMILLYRWLLHYRARP